MPSEPQSSDPASAADQQPPAESPLNAPNASALTPQERERAILNSNIPLRVFGPVSAGASLGAIRWLFLIVLGAAVTNGTRIYLTGSLAGPDLQWSSRGPYDHAFFGLFVFEVIVTALGVFDFLRDNNEPVSEDAGSGFGSIIDAIFLVATGVLFFAVSVTLVHTSTAPLPYFYLFGLIFLLTTLWFNINSLDIWRHPNAQKLVPLLQVNIQLLAPVGIGALLLYLAVPMNWLLAVVAGDVLLNILRLINVLPGVSRVSRTLTSDDT